MTIEFKRYYVMLINNHIVEHRFKVNTHDIQQAIKAYKEMYDEVKVVLLGD